MYVCIYIYIYIYIYTYIYIYIYIYRPASPPSLRHRAKGKPAAARLQPPWGLFRTEILHVDGFDSIRI